MAKKHQDGEVAPEETTPGQQQDDNIDDLGRRTDGAELDQPVDPEPGKGENDSDGVSPKEK